MIVEFCKSFFWLSFLVGSGAKVFGVPAETYPKSSNCGYDSCPDLSDDLIHVHLVPHTHDDVGWLKNPEEYFYGARDDIQRADVMYIIESVVDELLKNEKRRFIYVEMYFFSKWWGLQSEKRKDQVRMLVQNGRLVFTNGGWVMNDEAATHYNAIIDQMSLGMRFLNDSFGSCGTPKVAWHIDPFGHSREQANLFTMMGFDSLFFARLDYDDKWKRLKEKRMEELWNAGNGDLFFGALYKHYGPPSGFCFDGVGCSDAPIVDDKKSYEYNVNERVAEFVEQAKVQSTRFKSNHIMMTMGNDFEYMMASKWFNNLDKLISHVNELQKNGSRINVLYSTPMCYTYALYNSNIEWTNKFDDFFPYASDPHSYWTGYFTSRPAQKGYIRRMNNLLQTSRHLSVLTQQNKTTGISKLEKAMAVNQHHDAVTGTEKQQVQDYYMKLLHDASVETQRDIQNWLNMKNVDFCPYRNISVCPMTENAVNFTAILYNPLTRNVTYYVRIPVSGSNYLIKDSEGNVVQGDIFPTLEKLNKLRRHHNSTAKYELTFPVTLNGLSTSKYTIEEATSINEASAKLQKVTKFVKNLKTTNHSVKNNQFLAPKTGDTFAFSFNFAWYNASTGANKEPASGAYCFRPEHQTPIVVLATSSEYYLGQVSTETRFNFTEDWLSVVVRSIEDKRYIEYEWLVGPIPVEDGFAKEVILQYSTSLRNNNTFYTDSNGRQMLQRIKDYRPTWNLKSTEPVSQNYYPINSRIFIRDETNGLQSTILTDRSQGGGSLNQGQIEVMVHRRDLADDGFGVGEALNETGQFGDGLIVRGIHRLLLTETLNADKLHRLEAEELFMQPLVFFSTDSQVNLPEPKPVELPENVHLLTLQQLNNNKVLLRLEHQFEKNEDTFLSRPVIVDLEKTFKNVFEIKNSRAMSLSGDQYVEDLERLKWSSTQGDSVNPDLSISGFRVGLKPMEIKTVELEVEYL